jgi:hypothetical protein
VRRLVGKTVEPSGYHHDIVRRILNTLRLEHWRIRSGVWPPRFPWEGSVGDRDGEGSTMVRPISVPSDALIVSSSPFLSGNSGPAVGIRASFVTVTQTWSKVVVAGIAVPLGLAVEVAKVVPDGKLGAAAREMPIDVLPEAAPEEFEPVPPPPQAARGDGRCKQGQQACNVPEYCDSGFHFSLLSDNSLFTAYARYAKRLAENYFARQEDPPFPCPGLATSRWVGYPLPCPQKMA